LIVDRPFSFIVNQISIKRRSSSFLVIIVTAVTTIVVVRIFRVSAGVIVIVSRSCGVVDGTVVGIRGIVVRRMLWTEKMRNVT
jgi:hypothetical protein